MLSHRNIFIIHWNHIYNGTYVIGIFLLMYLEKLKNLKSSTIELNIFRCTLRVRLWQDISIFVCMRTHKSVGQIFEMTLQWWLYVMWYMTIIYDWMTENINERLKTDDTSQITSSKNIFDVFTEKIEKKIIAPGQLSALIRNILII